MSQASAEQEHLGSDVVRVIVRRPKAGFGWQDLTEVWDYRHLLQRLVWRNTIVRYKQSVVGIGWAVIRPTIQMVIFTIVFGRLAKLPTPKNNTVPYQILTFIALLPWDYFRSSVTSASLSLVNSAGVLGKVYFPRVILPLSNLFTGLVDFACASVVLVGMMLWYHDCVAVTWGILCLPFFILLSMTVALSVSLWMSATMVRYRDVQHILPFVVQCWMYISPVAYTAELVPDKWRLVYSLNPMVGVICGFRWALLGTQPPDWTSLAASVGVTLTVLVTGLFYFSRAEASFADII